MECAGRALSFWSYQMTNQMSVSLLPRPCWAATYWWKLIPSAEEQQVEGLLRRASGGDREHMGPGQPENHHPDNQDTRSAHALHRIPSTPLTLPRYGTGGAHPETPMRGPPPHSREPDQRTLAVPGALQQVEAESLAQSDSGSPAQRFEIPNPSTSSWHIRPRPQGGPVAAASSCDASRRQNRSLQLLPSEPRVLEDPTQLNNFGGME
jgi:hypothetical protein